MKDLSKVLCDLQEYFDLCSFCQSATNAFCTLEPCLHRMCLLCLDDWIEKQRKCKECNQYITFIVVGENKIHINHWLDNKALMLRITFSHLTRKVLLRKLIDRRFSVWQKCNELNATITDPLIDGVSKAEAKVQLQILNHEMITYLEMIRRHSHHSNEEIEDQLSGESLDTMDEEVHKLFKLLFSHCLIQAKVEVTEVTMYIIETINDYLSNIHNYVII